jgi:hypothetical protein
MAGSSRLEQIRASMAGEKLAAAPEQPAVASGAASDTPQGTGQKEAGVARLDDLRASLRDKAAGDPTASAG